MAEHATRPTVVVIFASDSRRVARFYETVLGLAREEDAAGFVLLGTAAVEVAVVQAPEDIRRGIEIASPAHLRTDTPIKPSFAVDAIEALRSRVEAQGGGLKPAHAAWAWRGALHLDGWDPEGNIFQLRQPSD